MSEPLQATVTAWEDGAGRAVLDDGTPVALRPGSLAAPLRRLRPGQRVQLGGVAGDPGDGLAAAHATLPGLPLPGPPGAAASTWDTAGDPEEGAP